MTKSETTNDLMSAVKTIKTAILQSQYKAAKTVNAEQLSLYFGIGKYVSQNSRNGFWGTGAIVNISQQLQKELPGLRGFSCESIKKMRRFYEQWSFIVNRSPMATDSPLSNNNEDIKIDSLTTAFRLPNAIDFNVQEFLSISFTHHIEILNKTEEYSERIFYIHQAFQNKWDKYKLREMLKADLFHKQETLPNNFSKSMPDAKKALKAIEMFKDEYLLDFINVEELGERDREDIDERVVEKEIIHNVKNFIMTFGHDFTFVGNQYHLEKFGHDSYPDLLFYNRELAALVVVELKKGDFKPAYLGQLSAYLRIIDSEIKKPFENPTIGIILCKRADKSFVEFLIQGYDNPMGVATYKTAEDVRRVLPSEDDLRKIIDQEF